ncbi:MAG: hypothetical protein NVSMB56_11030 [Pyrinomonadaceae bacterium]
MKNTSRFIYLRCIALFTVAVFFAQPAPAQTQPTPVMPQINTPKFLFTKSDLELERPTRAGAFYDVVGKKSAVFGYENRAAEAWVYPLKVLDDFDLAFHLETYPLEFSARDILTHINVRPEATTFTYSHAAFTVKQTIYAPVDENGVVMLFDVQSVLPLTISASFRPHMRLAWPAGLMTAGVDWNEKEHTYAIIEETHRFVGMIGSPTARDVSVTPYQEEPRDVPNRFFIEFSPEDARTKFIPIVIAGSTEGRAQAKATYDKLLREAQQLYEKNVAYYQNFERNTTRIVTPDARLNESFAWAKIGIDKGMATNPYLGTGLLAGFRTSGDSERPGFAWFFGRDALWTSFALNSDGDFNSTRTALAFLKKFQRADGKIPHEISQSANLVDWFNAYPYAWASADATPLYVIAHADYFNATGDREFLRTNWDSILKAYRFTEATDTDKNNLIENTTFGHGWVEGGALYPPHEEIYMQGLWIEASRRIAELAKEMNDADTAARALNHAEATREATEKTYWLESKGFYTYATKLTTQKSLTAEPGPNRAARQNRLDALRDKVVYDEDTVLPAVALWWHTLDPARAQSEITHLGGAQIATDWGARIIANTSELYDPLSYHYGSVWPLFTGWSAMAAYRYGRPHIGYQALMANALLYKQNALGYVTELLSGDFNAPFGRSSHHQVWSEAMVVTPTIRGLFGAEVFDGGRAIRFAPQFPANWESANLLELSNGKGVFDFKMQRERGRMTIDIKQEKAREPTRITLAPSFPLDARIRAVKVGGRNTKFEIVREGDVQRSVVVIENLTTNAVAEFLYDEGTDVYDEQRALIAGQTSRGLRVISSRAEADGLHLILEGRGGRTYELGIRTLKQIGALKDASGVMIKQNKSGDARLIVTFDARSDTYLRREITIPLVTRK